MASDDEAGTGAWLVPGAEVHFLHEPRGEVEAVRAAPDLDEALARDAALRARFAEDGVLSWTVQTWSRLRALGYRGLSLGTAPRAGAINVAAARQLLRGPWWREHFCVAIEADYPRIWWAELQVQQNPAACRRGDIALPHWPQPALIPRDAGRAGVRRVSFLGKTAGNLAWPPERMARALAAEGLEFHAPGPAEWHDYRATDIAVAVRSFDGRCWDDRPASKLVNAWLAGVPFVGGPDSAYAAAGRAGTDYLAVRSPEELLAALRRLRDEPELRARLVAAGHAAARGHDAAAVARAWVAALRGPVADRFAAWQARPVRARIRRRVLGSAFAALESGRAAGRVARGLPRRWP